MTSLKIYTKRCKREKEDIPTHPQLREEIRTYLRMIAYLIPKRVAELTNLNRLGNMIPGKSMNYRKMMLMLF